MTKNLSGMEIDPRAGQFASLVLAMCSREHDRRFFKRGVSANILTLQPVAFEEGDLPEGCAFAKKRPLLDALAHLDEVGSLLAPNSTDLAAIREAIELCGGLQSGLFAGNTREKLKVALANCEALASKFSCVVANPPYLGSSSFDSFMSKWIKKNYADVKSDLCTCFISRIFSLTEEAGLAGLATSNSWMFLSSYENLRQQLVTTKTIDSLVQLSVHGFHGIAAQVCTFVIRNKHVAGYRGGYIRLNDFDHWSLQEGRTLEAIRDPECGWFYRRDAEAFRQIPGTPIAYWFGQGARLSFKEGLPLSAISSLAQGLKCGDTDLFVRCWFECSYRDILGVAGNPSRVKWHFMLDGGDYRKWSGNQTDVVNWSDDGYEIKTNRDKNGKVRARVQNERFYHRNGTLTWSALTSGPISVRACSDNSLCGGAGYYIVPNDQEERFFILGLLNSSTAQYLKLGLSQTLNNEVGDLKRIPVCGQDSSSDEIAEIVQESYLASGSDWDSFETSWNFKRHPLV